MQIININRTKAALINNQNGHTVLARSAQLRSGTPRMRTNPRLKILPGDSAKQAFERNAS